MSNLTNAQAVITNLEAIITSTLSWKLEDSSTDPDISSITLVFIDLDTLNFEDTFGEHVERNELNLKMIVKRRYATPAAARDGGLDIAFALRGAITSSTLNVGALASSKMVDWVSHEGASFNRSDTVIECEYGIKIKIAEE